MIARTWRGVTRASDADAYVEYLGRTGFDEYAATPGNASVLGLRRLRGDRAEFLIVTLWEAPQAIERFAGRDVEGAVFYPEDDDYLVERDEHVDHYEVVHQQWRGRTAETPRNMLQRVVGRVFGWLRGGLPATAATSAEAVAPAAKGGWTLIGLR